MIDLCNTCSLIIFVSIKIITFNYCYFSLFDVYVRRPTTLRPCSIKCALLWLLLVFYLYYYHLFIISCIYLMLLIFYTFYSLAAPQASARSQKMKNSSLSWARSLRLLLILFKSKQYFIVYIKWSPCNNPEPRVRAITSYYEIVHIDNGQI